MNRYRRTIVFAVLAVAIAAGGVYFSRGRKPPATKYETTKVERGRLVARVTATGTLSALVTVQVGAQVSGRIAQLFADFNSAVTKGQTIAKLDPQLFRAAVEQANANLLAAEGNHLRAQAQAVDARRQAERAKALRAEKLIAQADTDTAQANAEAAEAQVKAAAGTVAQARASLHQAEINLAYTTIVSPIDGVVISRNVDVGQTVAAALQAPTLFTIAEDLRKMQVDTNVAEADVGRLKAGGPASFTVDAWPGERFRGRIRQIRNAPQTVQNVVTYDAVIDVENPELRLKPGMTANVSFVYAEKDEVLKVPNAALRFRATPELLKAAGLDKKGGAPAAPPDGGAPVVSAGGERKGPPGGGEGRGRWAGGGGRRGEEGASDRRTVWVLRDTVTPGQTPVPVQVKTGVSDGSFTEIVEGDLKEGDALVTDVASAEGGGARPGGAGGPPGGGMPRRMF